MTVRPGEIYLLFEDEGKQRPAIVISREELNRGDYLLVVPLTTSRLKIRERLPNTVLLKHSKYGISKDSIAQAEMISYIRKDYMLLTEGPIGVLDNETFRSLVRAVGYVMSADCEPV